MTNSPSSCPVSPCLTQFKIADFARKQSGVEVRETSTPSDLTSALRSLTLDVVDKTNITPFNVAKRVNIQRTRATQNLVDLPLSRERHTSTPVDLPLFAERHTSTDSVDLPLFVERHTSTKEQLRIDYERSRQNAIRNQVLLAPKKKKPPKKRQPPRVRGYVPNAGFDTDFPDDSDNESDDGDVYQDCEELRSFFGDISAIFSDIVPNLPGNSSVDDIIDNLEAVALFCLTLRECKSVQGMVSVTLLYCKRFTTGSLYMKLSSWIWKILGGYTPQAGQSAVVDGMDLILSNWQSFSQAPIFGYFSKILSIAIALGLSSATQMEFKFDELNLFTIEAAKTHNTAYDLFDAVLKTAHFFITAGVEAIQTGSLRPFLFANQRLAKLDTLYFQVLAAMRVLGSGSLHLCDIKTEDDLRAAIDKLISELEELRVVEKTDALARRMMDVRLSKAHEWKSEFLARSQGGELRIAPYTFLIWGKSGVGKSEITQKLIQALLCHNGFTYDDPKKIVTISTCDKFVSNAKSDVLAYIFDDMGASPPAMQEVNHARRWLDMSNQVAGYAIKAGVEEKGTCTFNHKIQAGTSNYHDGGMTPYSNYPIATARRGTRDEIKLKPTYQGNNGIVDSAKVFNDFPNDPYPDIYDISVKVAVESTTNLGQYNYVTETFQDALGNMITMDNVSYKTYVNYHLAKSVIHFATQKVQIDKMKKGPKALYMCPLHNCISTLCVCYKPQFGLETVCDFVCNAAVKRVEVRATNWALDHAGQIIDRYALYLAPINLLPDCIFRHPLFQGLLEWQFLNYHSQWLAMHDGVLLFLMLVWAIITHIYLGSFFSLPVLLFCHYLRCLYLRVAVLFSKHILEESRLHFATYFDLHRRQIYKGMVGGTIILLAGVLIHKLIRLRRRFSMDIQGNLAPTSVDDIKERDGEANPWLSLSVAPIPKQEACKTINVEQLSNKIRKNQLYVNVSDGEGRRMFCNALMIETGFCILPAHMIFKECREYTFSRDKPTVLGTSFRCRLSKSDVIGISNSDLVLAYIPSGGSFGSLVNYLALESPTRGSAVMIYKAKDGSSLSEQFFPFKKGVIACPGAVGNEINGVTYDLPYDSFSGLCCGTLLTYSPQPCIFALHSAGQPLTRHGAGSLINLSAYGNAKAFFTNMTSVLSPCGVGEIAEVQYGKNFITSSDIHPKSPLNFLEKERVTSCNVYGSVIGRSKYFSEVIKSPIADAVEEVFEEPNIYGKPAFHLGKHWREHIAKALTPSMGCSQTILEHAVEDYLKPFEVQVAIVKEASPIAPLDLPQVVNGIDGLRFIDRMKPSTSMGFPINQPKSDYLVPCEGENAVNFDFTPEVWDQYHKDLATYKSGKRAYPIFRACLKDEVKKKTSEKVRVFQAAPISLQILVRQYFLPIARVVSLLPLTSECAVGINAHSDEWDQLMSHLRKFGEDRFIAGDYSAYDTRMPAQFTLASFSILIEIAKMLGDYSDEDMLVMRGIATDIAYPLMAYNGDLLELLGSNPSGQNLTVYINSICNSLYFRCVFFSLYPELVFRDHVSITTYGDDVVGGVSESVPNFNFISVKENLALMDIKFTPPDKDSLIAEKYVPFTEIDFLKRKSVFFEPLKHEVGVLCEDSIRKSLYCVLKSKSVLPEVQSASCMDSALHEWFYHGEDVFEDRRAKLLLVAQKTGIFSPSLELDFKARLEKLLPQE